MTAIVERTKQASPDVTRDAARSAVRWYGSVTSGHRPPPDFLIIGAKRGGTTTLFRAIQDHPQVLPMFPSSQNLKSSHFYDLERDRPFEWFLSHFPSDRARRAARAQPAITGEASPYYLFHPNVPADVRRDLPGVKLIVVLRDPVARAFSHHWDRTKNGVETLPFSIAIDREQDRLSGERARLIEYPTSTSHAHEHFSYLARGRYAEQLEAWFEHFPRDQVLVLRSEDLYRDPQVTYDHVLAFLGIEPHQRRGEFGRHHGHDDRPMIDPADEARLREYFEPHNQRLADLLTTSGTWW